MQESHSSQVSLKTVFTVCFGVLAICGLAVFVAKTLSALALSLTALMAAVALNHLVDALVQRRVPRRTAILIVFVGVNALLVGLAFTIVPPAVAQGKAFVEQFPEYVASVRTSPLFVTLENRLHLTERLRELEQRGPRMWQEAATPVLTVVGGLVRGIATVVTVVVVAILMVIFGRSLLQAFLSEALPHNRPLYSKVIDKIYRSIGGYLAGLTLICSGNSLAATTFLALLGVPFFLPLGLLSGASSLVPYAGPAVAGALISIIAAVTTSIWKGLACGIFFVVYGQLEGNILAPLIFRRTVHVNPLVVALSILFLGELAGIFGALLAVPAVAAVQIVLREILRARRERLRLPPSPFDRPSNPVSS